MSGFGPLVTVTKGDLHTASAEATAPNSPQLVRSVQCLMWVQGFSGLMLLALAYTQWTQQQAVQHHATEQAEGMHRLQRELITRIEQVNQKAGMLTGEPIAPIRFHFRFSDNSTTPMLPINAELQQMSPQRRRVAPQANKDGLVDFGIQPAGEYELIVDYRGYSFRRSVTVHAGRPVDQSICCPSGLEPGYLLDLQFGMVEGRSVSPHAAKTAVVETAAWDAATASRMAELSDLTAHGGEWEWFAHISTAAIRVVDDVWTPRRPESGSSSNPVDGVGDVAESQAEMLVRITPGSQQPAGVSATPRRSGRGPVEHRSRHMSESGRGEPDRSDAGDSFPEMVLVDGQLAFRSWSDRYGTIVGISLARRGEQNRYQIVGTVRLDRGWIHRESAQAVCAGMGAAADSSAALSDNENYEAAVNAPGPRPNAPSGLAPLSKTNPPSVAINPLDEPGREWMWSVPANIQLRLIELWDRRSQEPAARPAAGMAARELESWHPGS